MRIVLTFSLKVEIYCALLLQSKIKYFGRASFCVFLPVFVFWERFVWKSEIRSN